jgi:ATP-dependent Lon protease
MANFMQSEVNPSIQIPDELPILPLRNTLAYPFLVLPLAVGISRSIRLIEDALQGRRLIGLVAMQDPTIEQPMPGEIHEVGTIATIQRVSRGPDNSMQVVVEGIERFRVVEWTSTEPYLRARISLIPDILDQDVELDALQRSLRDITREVVALSPHLPDEVNKFLAQVEDPRHLLYLVAANVRLKIEEGQQLLEADDLKEKYRLLISHLTREKEVLTLEQKIQSEAHEEMEKAQREYYLRQQLKAIQKELGEEEEAQAANEEYRQKIDQAMLPEEARKECLRELKRLQHIPPHAPEHALIKTYLDWMTELPWNKLTDDQLDIEHARRVLDEDHYDLQEVKERLLEYLAVRKLVKERKDEIDVRASSPERQGQRERAASATPPFGLEGKNGTLGAVLCFVGPPGVGKTSLGQSIARALGRKFTRMSLGGMRDEAEIRGHRRTYVGAMPGRIIQAIKRAGTRNPVFMLDEIDKVGMDWRGDPSSALLEVLDPAQNHAFRDHYLDVDFSLSDVIFIATANQLDTIPPPLRDRMEIIHLDGYTEHEKVHIARQYLLPRELLANGLRQGEVDITDDGLRKIVRDYTREAGVRELQRRIGAICRKVAVKLAGGESGPVEVKRETVPDFLKHEKYFSEAAEQIEIPGIATGLAVTATGGDILFIEATRMRGKGGLTLTGQLGDVMRESAQIAHSYVRSNAERWGIDPSRFENMDVHVHVPAGAIPKDGPSAGVAMVTSIVSLLTDQPAHHMVGMTGEVTLRGRVLPVGGVKMKVLAAHRAGLDTVILPKRNEHDLEDLPEDVRQEMNFVLVEQIDEVLSTALISAPRERKGERKAEASIEV